MEEAEVRVSVSGLIGMVHVGPLPGSPGYGGDLGAVIARAVRDARVLASSGFDGLIVENMHDRPYVNGPHGPETVASMTAVACAVAGEAGGLRVGVQVLSRGEEEALAVAQACGGSFVRCENFVYAHVADEGLMGEACAGRLLRRRRAMGAEGVAVLADVRKKHASHALTSDLSLGEVVRAAEFFGADGVIVTGRFTGEAVSLGDVEEAKGATGLPVLVGSGVEAGNVRRLLGVADGVIVGSWIKEGGDWRRPVSAERCARLVEAAGR